MLGSPIAVTSPFLKVTLPVSSVGYELKEPMDVAVKNDGSKVKILDDFGAIAIQDVVYTASELAFYSKSLHSFGESGQRTDMEI